MLFVSEKKPRLMSSMTTCSAEVWAISVWNFTPRNQTRGRFTIPSERETKPSFRLEHNRASSARMAESCASVVEYVKRWALKVGHGPNRSTHVSEERFHCGHKDCHPTGHLTMDRYPTLNGWHGIYDCSGTSRITSITRKNSGTNHGRVFCRRRRDLGTRGKLKTCSRSSLSTSASFAKSSVSLGSALDSTSVCPMPL